MSHSWHHLTHAVGSDVQKWKKTENRLLISSPTHLFPSFDDEVYLWVTDDVIWSLSWCQSQKWKIMNHRWCHVTLCGRPSKMKKCVLPYNFLSNTFTFVFLWQRWIIWWGQIPENKIKIVNHLSISSPPHLVLSLYNEVELWVIDDVFLPLWWGRPLKMKNCESPLD